MVDILLIGGNMSGGPTSGRRLSKSYDFRVMGNLDEFTTQFIWPREQVINEELQFYVDPGSTPDGYSPFVLNDAGLSIVASQTHPELYNYAIALDAEGRKLKKPLTEEQLAAHGSMQPYVSGLLTTRDRGHSQIDGYWEMMAKLPSAKGAWPAFWLLPTFERWPSGVAVLPEIDIMEAVFDVIEGIYHGTVHTNINGRSIPSEGNHIKTGKDLVGEYHRYGLSKNDESLVWYFDDKEVIRRDTPKDLKGVPMHMLINLAVGGRWAGEANPEDYPASFDIKWINVWDEPPKPDKKPKKRSTNVIHTLATGQVVTKPTIENVAHYLIELDNNATKDVISTLHDGRAVTRSHLYLVAQMLLEINSGISNE